VSAPRTPVIAGLSGGAGTSTLAAALHARDGGRRVAAADVLVCRSTEGALRDAAALSGRTEGPPPVLAVTLGTATPTRGLAARLRALEPRFAAVVLLPHVSRWRGLVGCHAEAATVLAAPHLPRPLRVYAAAVRLVAAAVVATGRLDRAAPPVVPGPRNLELWRDLRPVQRAATIRPVLLAAPRPVVPVPVAGHRPAAPAPLRAVHRADTALPELDDDALDDDALEAGCPPPVVAARRAG
jgi:hypothetical protein